jgi:hypothetical protein
MEVVFSNGETTQSNGVDSQPSLAGTNIAAAVTDVASATETLAESIVDSILQPTMSLTGSSAITLPSSGPDEADDPIQQQRIEDQEMEHVPVEVQEGVGAAPDFSELTTGLLSSLSEILPSVTAAQRALSGVSQGAESESYPEASYESSYPTSASSLDSTQLGSMLAQSCNTVTPAPTSSYNRDDGEDCDEARSPPQGPVSADREHAEGDYDSDNSSLNPACGPPPPLIPLEEVVNMDVAEAADEEEDNDEEDEDVPVSYSHQNSSHTLLESIRRTGHAPQNLQDALDMFAFESTGRLINEMEDTSDISGLGMVREVEGVQAPISNGVRHPMNGSESLDLEAAASWLRSQVEARVSQHQRDGEAPEQSSHLASHYEESQPQVDSVNHRSASAFENR